jgi:hypothetical protein
MDTFRRRRIKRLVRDLYRSLLGREPDPEGAQTYESLLLRRAPEVALRKMLKAFVRSSEYRQRTARMASAHVNAQLASQGRGLVHGRPVSHLVSLGTFCLPTLIQQDNGLRSYSLPFDWIFSTPQMVCDCLADDFATFLDPRHYRSIQDPKRNDPTSEVAADHILYREKYGINGLFAHRDPSRDSDHLYYVRCVNRFRRILRSRDSKLFWIIGRAQHDLPNQFPLLLESLSRVALNFELLGIELLDPTEKGLSSIVPINRHGSHALYRFIPSSFDPVGNFLPEELDQWGLLRLIYRYSLELKDSPWHESIEAEPAAETESAADGNAPAEQILS